MSKEWGITVKHYFTDNQQETHNRKEISFRFLSIQYTFVTDSGVFSPNDIDLGGIALIEAYLKLNQQGSILDLGCGYGNVAIILSKILNQQVTGVDINSRAVSLAIENNSINSTACNFLVSDGFQQLNQQFDTILFNPPIHAGKDMYYPLFQKSYNHLNEGGQLLVVMRKSHGLKSAISFCESLFKTIEIVHKNKGYFVFKCSK